MHSIHSKKYIDLAKSYDNGKQTDVVFMDVAKAISSFLSDHHQKVVIDNVSSDSVSVVSGVPQGTVLGTILFIIYINDVIENIKHSKIWLFADDIVLYKEISAVRMPNNSKKT